MQLDRRVWSSKAIGVPTTESGRCRSPQRRKSLTNRANGGRGVTDAETAAAHSEEWSGRRAIRMVGMRSCLATNGRDQRGSRKSVHGNAGKRRAGCGPGIIRVGT